MISVIIPTFNREKSMNTALQSLIRQDFPIEQFELLIVDNGSTDATKSISEKIISQHPSSRIRYIYEPEPGLLSGRHRGALEAEGDILTFIDDDIEADVNWLQAIEESFTDPSVQIVGGRNLPKYEAEPPAWLEWFWAKHPQGRYCGYLSLLDLGDQVTEIDANLVWGLNFSIRKKALFELGGFHPDSIPKHLQHFQGDGETGLTLKAKQLGYKALYQPKALVFHEVSKERMTYEYFDKRYFYQGVCDSYTSLRREYIKLKKNIFFNRIMSFFKTGIKLYWKKVKHKTSVLNNKLDERKILHQRFYQSFLKGYQFHQNVVMKNPKIIDWIVKKDYWDYKLPQITVRLPRK